MLLTACDSGESKADSGPPALPLGMGLPRTTNADATPPRIPYSASTPRIVFHVSRVFPHDTSAFTEGLLVHAGRVLESTGLEGHSEIRDMDPSSGRVLRRTALAPTLFGEGIAVVGPRLYQLTWQSGRGYVYDVATLAPVDSFSFSGEGWGLTSDGALLYMSDGTDRVKVVDPADFRTVRTIAVTEAGQPVWMVNELEWVRGELWANIYRTDLIARIDPGTGRVLGWIDVGLLLTPAEQQGVSARSGLANGIAFDSVRSRIYVTGKMWPHAFEANLGSLTPVDVAHPVSRAGTSGKPNQSR
ncbi:MAG TPA: glutaminyl-peptide cyclotransferase [Candidatus Elarobacter sp.]|nr:glutaminyl-peptide cyclotransferase [Candidatus Elarobacter sp.]